MSFYWCVYFRNTFQYFSHNETLRAQSSELRKLPSTPSYLHTDVPAQPLQMTLISKQKGQTEAFPAPAAILILDSRRHVRVMEALEYSNAQATPQTNFITITCYDSHTSIFLTGSLVIFMCISG